MFRICVAFVLVTVGFLAGCASPSGPSAGSGSPDATRDYITDTRYRPGDKVLIDFADNPGIPTLWQQVVREDGTITLPFNQNLLAQGLRKAELEQGIHDLYVPKILKRLTVNVRAEQRTYFVSGEVKTPGQREHTGAITALKAIAACGDFTDFADKNEIEIIRANGEKIKLDGKAAQRDPTKDVPVHPGDTVHVHRRWL